MTDEELDSIILMEARQIVTKFCNKKEDKAKVLNGQFDDWLPIPIPVAVYILNQKEVIDNDQ